jgi:hypothetical protein
MWNGRALHVELDQILLGLLDALFDGHGHFARFAHTETGVAATVPNNNKRRKAQVLAALHDFGDAIDGNDVVL